MGRRPIYKFDEFFKSTPLVDQIYLDMTAVAHRTGVAPFGIRSHLLSEETCARRARVGGASVPYLKERRNWAQTGHFLSNKWALWALAEAVV